MRKVAIFGPPRSGTTWLSHIFNSHPDVALRFQPLFSYGHKGALSRCSSREEINDFYQAILRSSDPFTLMEGETQKAYPSFTKSSELTHIIFKETRYLQVIENLLRRGDDVIVIGIIRHPLATLASWARAPREFSFDWDIRQEWRLAPKKNAGRPEEWYGFERWKEAALTFLRFESSYPERFKLVRYSLLNRSPTSVSTELFRFCGLASHPQVMDFIQSSRSRQSDDPYSIYRLPSDDLRWLDELPGDIVDTVRRELESSPLQEFIVSGGV
jgi:hypothetical protein